MCCEQAMIRQYDDAAKAEAQAALISAYQHLSSAIHSKDDAEIVTAGKRFHQAFEKAKSLALPFVDEFDFQTELELLLPAIVEARQREKMNGMLNGVQAPECSFEGVPTSSCYS